MAVNDSALLQSSPLHSWIGIAADDKMPNSIMLNVIIAELTPAATGTVASSTATQSVQLKDITGATINNKVTTGNSITAYYLGNTSNRKYPPDVVKGEQVKVTRLANADKYYWESLGRDDAMRKTETLRMEVANRKEFADKADDDHTYNVEIDTKVNQHIRMQTSKGNGETYTYQFKLDAKSGAITLADDIGNSLTVDSANAKVILRNSKNAFMMLNGEDAVFAAPRDITIKADRQLLIQSPLITIAAQGGSNVISMISNYISQAASSAVTTTAPAIGLTGAVKMPNILTVGSVRAGIYTNGDVGAPYPAASIGLDKASANISVVAPDITLPSIQRHGTAWEDFNAAMILVVSCFSDIQGQIGVPITQKQTMITASSVAANMPKLQGT